MLLAAENARASRGAAGAQILLVELSDFACDGCKRLARQLAVIDARHVRNGTVRRVFRHFAASQDSFEAAVAVECAGADRFWDIYDAVLGSSESATVPSGLGVMKDKVAAPAECVAGSGGDAVRHDMAVAASLNIMRAPTIFISVRDVDGSGFTPRRFIVGVPPVGHIARVLDEVIREVDRKGSVEQRSEVVVR
jgi:protein-disulfide isomerase